MWWNLGGGGGGGCASVGMYFSYEFSRDIGIPQAIVSKDKTSIDPHELPSRCLFQRDIGVPLSCDTEIVWGPVYIGAIFAFLLKK